MTRRWKIVLLGESDWAFDEDFPMATVGQLYCSPRDDFTDIALIMLAGIRDGINTIHTPAHRPHQEG